MLLYLSVRVTLPESSAFNYISSHLYILDVVMNFSPSPPRNDVTNGAENLFSDVPEVERKEWVSRMVETAVSTGLAVTTRTP